MTMNYPAREKSVEAREFSMCVSMEDLILRTGEDDDDFVPHPELERALAAIGVKPDICELQKMYFRSPRVGSGDVYAFHNSTIAGNVFVIDMYQEVTDQLDLVCLAFKSDAANLPVVRQSLRAFFDAASAQVGYEEGGSSARLMTLLDGKIYPRVLSDSGYQQQLHTTV